MMTTIKYDVATSRALRKWLRECIATALGPRATMMSWAGPFGSGTDKQFVVMTKWDHGSYFEFTTHRVNGHTGYMDVGHYFNRREDAREDFLYRAEQEKRYAA